MSWESDKYPNTTRFGTRQYLCCCLDLLCKLKKQWLSSWRTTNSHILCFSLCFTPSNFTYSQSHMMYRVHFQSNYFRCTFLWTQPFSLDYQAPTIPCTLNMSLLAFWPILLLKWGKSCHQTVSLDNVGPPSSIVIC